MSGGVRNIKRDCCKFFSKTYFAGLVFVILFASSSCKKENENTKPYWHTNIVAPLAYTNLSIFDILNDSIVETGADSMVFLVFRNEFTSLSIDSILQIPDTNISFQAKLDNLELGNFNLSDSISLGALAEKDYETNGSSGAIYTAVNNALNTGLPVDIDPIPQQQYSDIDLDASEYFQSIEVKSGKISISIKNDLILPVSDLVLEIRNASNNNLIISDTFPDIPVNSTVYSEKLINNSTIEGSLVGLVKFASPGANNVIITPEDTSRVIKAEIKIFDIKLNSAIARFPNQDIINLEDKIVLDIPDNIELNSIKAKSGIIKMTIYNTLPKPINFNFEMPGVTKNGGSLSISGEIPASNNNVQGRFEQNIFLEDYTFLMTGINNDTVNTLQYKLNARIDSSGEYVNLSLDDSVYAMCEILNMQPEYAKAWFGNDEYNITGKSEIDLPAEISNAIVNFSGVKLNLELQNTIGTSGKVYFNNIIAENTINGNTEQLNIPGAYNPFLIEKPLDPGNNNVMPTVNIADINNVNSNTDDFINILPDRISYDINFEVNSGVVRPVPPAYENFIYSNSYLKGMLNIELPLNFIAENLILSDTLSLNIDDEQTIDNGIFYLFAYNDFPLDAEIQLYIMQENQISDSLIIGNNTIFAGNIDSNTGKVLSAQRTQIKIPVLQNKMQKILESKRLIVKVRFATKPVNSHVRIYSNYNVKLKISADFEYSTQ